MRSDSPQSQYIEKYFSADHPALEKLKKELKHDQLDFMSVSPSEARLLQFFIQTFEIKTVVEIGSLYGYSAMAMGLCLPEEGHLYCFEKETSRAEKIRQTLSEASLSCSFDVLAGEALQELKKIESKGPFDLVFVDANKGAYVDYLDWAEAHTKKGSLIIGDNTFLFGALWGEVQSNRISEKQVAVMKEFNRRLSDKKKYHSIMIPTPEGMTVSRRRD